MYRLVRTLVLAGTSLTFPGAFAVQPAIAEERSADSRPGVVADAGEQKKTSVAGGSTPQCQPEHELPPTDDWNWKWRLLAFRHLDCVVAMVDAALARDAAPAARPADPQAAAVPIRREELEHIRSLAWWARDAAARIGR